MLLSMTKKEFDNEVELVRTVFDLLGEYIDEDTRSALELELKNLIEEGKSVGAISMGPADPLGVMSIYIDEQFVLDIGNTFLNYAIEAGPLVMSLIKMTVKSIDSFNDIMDKFIK